MRFTVLLGCSVIAASLAIACGSDETTSGEEAAPLPERKPDDPTAPAADPSTPPNGATEPPPSAAITTTTSVIHKEHRAIPGVMFGGWGPHLGHLVRQASADGKSSTLWFVDDACAPASCNVNVNQRLDYLRFVDANKGWEKVDSISLPGTIQQNTATILSGTKAVSYGVDSGAQSLIECSRDLAAPAGQVAKGCSAVSSAIGASANYVGAALTPGGDRMAWYTNVKDGGGGSFSFFINYGGGWNGPRAGAIGGFNDASYINVAFGVNGDPTRFTMYSELVSGVAPAWSFVAGVGEGNTNVAAPVTWATSLAAPPNDPVITPNDVLVDPRTADTHWLGRTKAGATVYYFRAKGKAEVVGPLDVIAKASRARLVALASGAIALVRSDDGAPGGLVVQIADVAAIKAGSPIAWSAAKTLRPALPVGYTQIYAIYTESASYSAAARTSLEIALVGKTHENEVLHVSMTGL